MAKRFYKERRLEYQNFATRPAERCFSLNFTLEDGRPAEARLGPEQARWIANRLLLDLRQHFPEAADCPHVQSEFIAGTCIECGAQVKPVLGSAERRARKENR